MTSKLVGVAKSSHMKRSGRGSSQCGQSYLDYSGQAAYMETHPYQIQSDVHILSRNPIILYHVSFCYLFLTTNQYMGKVLGIIVQKSSVSKSNWLYVVIFQFFFVNLGYFPYIPLK